MQSLNQRAESTSAKAKAAGEFVFGSATDFIDGLVGMIGMPTGFDEAQWLQSMEREHCDVDPGVTGSTHWGASDREWTTGNYNLQTAPNSEFRWVVPVTVGSPGWDEQQAEDAPGGYTVQGSVRDEDTAVRRRALSVQALCAEAPQRAFDMLRALADARVAQFEVPAEDFLQSFLDLHVNRAEIVSLRLYTGPMFEFYNTVLRTRGTIVGEGSRYPYQKEGTDGKTADCFITTLHSVTSGILKLSSLTPVLTVYRGARGRKLPPQLLETDSFNSRLGIEFGLMSTTTDQAVAIKYSQDSDRERNLSYCMEFPMDTLNRGATIQFLSQYPAEAEVLFGPLTGLEVMHSRLQGDTTYIRFRPTVNQRTVRIEELVGRRKALHIEGVKNLRAELQSELKASGLGRNELDLANTTLLGHFDRHLDALNVMDALSFNQDELYKVVVVGTMDLKTLLRRILNAFASCVGHVTTVEGPASLLAYLCSEDMSFVVSLGVLDTDMAEDGTVFQKGREDYAAAERIVVERVQATESAASEWAAVSSDERARLSTMANKIREDVGESDAMVCLLNAGLGTCLNHLLSLDAQTIMGISEFVAKNRDVPDLSAAGLLGVTESLAAAAVLDCLLSTPNVQSFGVVQYRALRTGVISEVNIAGKSVSPCESGLIAHFFSSPGCESFDRIVLNNETTITRDVWAQTSLDLQNKNIGLDECKILAVLFGIAPNARTVDLSGNLGIGEGSTMGNSGRLDALANIVPPMCNLEL
eukprot:SAG22_NODE_2424_length_2587_cov_1.512058_2_plen_754_part_01